MTEKEKKISRLIKQKSGIEWSPQKEFDSYEDALDFTLMVESNSNLICYEIEEVDKNKPFGKQRIKKIITKEDWLQL